MDTKKLIENLSEEQKEEILIELGVKKKKKTPKIPCKNYRRKEIRTRFLNPEEWSTIIMSVTPRMRDAMMLMFLTGMRYKEAKNVTKQHIDYPNRTIIVYKPKGGKIQRYVNFSSYGKKKIKQIFEYKKTDEKLDMPTVGKIGSTLKETAKKFEILYWQDLSCHNIRKTHENYLISLNFSDAKITAHMGHTPKTAKEHYISSKIIKDKKELDTIKGWFGDIFG